MRKVYERALRHITPDPNGWDTFVTNKAKLPDNWIARFSGVRKWCFRGKRLVQYSIAPVYCGERSMYVLGFSYVVSMHKANNRQWRENRLRRLECLARGLATRLTR